MAGFFADQRRPQMPETLEEINEGKVPRDQYDRPLIRQANGDLEPYNRASSYGGQIENKDAVEEWTRRQVVRGIALQPDLLKAVPAGALADLWKDLEKSEKKALSRVSDRAQEIAGSNLKSELGTQIHAATEFVDRGDDLEWNLREFPPERRALLIERANAYYKTTREFGLVHDSIETFGVQDELMVAGTWDRRSFVPWWPEHRQTIVDVKTSSSLDFAGIGFAVQLATYAHMCAYDVETGTRTPHDDMNERWALIVHVDRNLGGHVEMARVDIARGWEQSRLAREIILARREKGLVEPIQEIEAAILTATSKAELEELIGNGRGWASYLLTIARQRWEQLP